MPTIRVSVIYVL